MLKKVEIKIIKTVHSKPQESRNEGCGVETHGNRPDLVKLVLRASLRGR